MLSDIKGIQTKIRRAVDLVGAPAPSRMERMAEIYAELSDVCMEADAFTKSLASRVASAEDTDPAEWHEDSIGMALHSLDALQDEVNALAAKPPALLIAQNTNEQEMRRKMLLPATAQQRLFQAVALTLNHVKDDLDAAEVHQLAARRKAHREWPPLDGVRDPDNTHDKPARAVDPGTPDERGRPRPQPVPTNARDKGPAGEPPQVNPATPPEANPGPAQR